MAGIVPLAAQPMDFNMPWHDALMPVAKGYCAVERAIFECACAGCETIWVICDREAEPLIRARCGEGIEDPVWFHRRHARFPSKQKRVIPIYYVSLPPKDNAFKKSIPWSLCYGAEMADRVSRQMSEWIVPDRFYAAFPYGIYSVVNIRQHRKLISSDKRFVIAEPSGMTFKDGFYTAFTFNMDDVKKIKKSFREQETGEWDASQPVEERRDGKYPTRKLPLEERYSGRFLKLEDVCEDIDFGDCFILELEWYYWGDSWDGLKEFLGSTKHYVRKPTYLFKYQPFNKIGEDE